MATELRLSAGTFVWGLQGICQLQRIPFAPGLVLQQFPPPYRLFSFQQAARALGLNSGLRGAHFAELPQLPTPFVAVLTPRAIDGQEPQADPEHRLGIVLECDAHNVRYFEDSKAEPVDSTLDQFAQQYAGEVLLCAPAAPPLKDEDAAPGKRADFGFRWFVPELLRHKAIWRDVLLASLAIQLMALATPIFTQVIIDRVIVHHTLSTLAVIGIALGVFIVFTAVMSWVRQWHRA